MEIEDKIKLTIETPAIGDVVFELNHGKSADEQGDNCFILDIPNKIFWGTNYTRLDFTHVVENDIERFEKLNSMSDENHQIHIDTLHIYGVKISGNYIRLQYWFDQYLDNSCHRMCAGGFSHCRINNGFRNEIIKVYPECYSTDACVYW